MHLITMAHHGEAQGVIEKFQLVKTGQDIFQNEQMVLVITGEGPFEASTKTALQLGKFPVAEIINLGIAGSLSERLQPGSFTEVRTLYLVQDLRPQFKTFQASLEGVDCLTSFERILDQEKAHALRGLGTVVDREAWGVAMAAKTANIPFRCFKLISDVAGSLGACELVKDAALEYSDRLATELGKIIAVPIPTENKLELHGFHFTFSTRHRFETLLQKLIIKGEKSEKEILATLQLDHLRALEVSPKERARRLLEVMEDKADPTRKVLQKTASELTKSFADKGMKLHIDPHWENPKATISFEVASDTELIQKGQELQSLSILSFTRLMNGDLHVE